MTTSRTVFSDETSGASPTIEWETYRKNRPIFDMLTDIQRFSLHFDIPPVPEMADAVFSGALATRMYKHVRDAVNHAKFYANDELSLTASGGSASVLYGDDRFDFGLEIRDGSITLQRQGSRFEDFHRFYADLFMHVPQMFNELRKEIADMTRRECTLVRGAYVFEFLIFDIQPASGVGRRVRNSEVMRKVITGVPGDDGVLSNSDSVLADAGRVDVNISRWVEMDTGMRLYRYSLEAPANKDGAALWVKFSYGGETYSSPSGRQQRTPFNADQFLTEYDRAYVGFLRDTAIGGFLASLFREYVFRTSAYLLP
jgi:hypothetical protein